MTDGDLGVPARARAGAATPKLEIGAGEYPDPAFDIHVDLLRLPGIDLVCRMDELPFADRRFAAVRANHVLEHQSWQLIVPTLQEWARVLVPGGVLEVGVPDARFVAQQWLAGRLDTEEANHWLMGGHAEREPHRGVDQHGHPLWLWNAHHAIFDAAWLRELLGTSGFEDIHVVRYDVRNLRCRCRRSATSVAPLGAPDGVTRLLDSVP